MTVKLAASVRQTRVNAVGSAVGASGTLKLWAGAVPSHPEAADPAAGNLLATIALGATAFANAAGSANNPVTAALDGTPLSATAANSGTATFFRLYTSGGTCVAQGEVGTDITVTPTAIVAGAQVSVSGYTLSEAA